MKNLTSREKGTIVLLVVFFLVVIWSTSGDRNTSRPLKKISNLTSLMSKEDQAIDFAVDAIINSKVTLLPKKCLSIVNVEKNDNIIVFEIHEIHGGDCPGDPNTSPLVTTAQVNMKTKEVGVQTNYRYPYDILDENKNKTGYFADGHYVYYKEKIINGADVDTFAYVSRKGVVENKNTNKSLIAGFGRDRDHVYINGKVIKGADVPTFKISDDGSFASDEYSNYSYNYETGSYEVDNNPCLGIKDCRE